MCRTWIVFALWAVSASAGTGQPVCLKLAGEQSPEQVIQLAQITDQEVLTRLVFAEGLSTGFQKAPECERLGAEIFQAIAWGVMNRVRLAEKSPRLAKKYGTGLRGVVFKPGQFNPAVSRKSRFSRLFLCPTESKAFEKDWANASQAASRSLSSNQGNPFIQTEWEKRTELSLVTHFYYPRSEQATRVPPPWADPSRATKTGVDSRCIWFFRLEEPFKF